MVGELGTLAPPPTEVASCDATVDETVEQSARSVLTPKTWLVAADAVTLVLAATIAAIALRGRDATAAWHLWSCAVATIPVWLAIFANQRLYNTRFIGRRIDEFRRIFNAAVLGTMSVAVAGSMAGVLLLRTGLVALGVTAVVAITLEREIARRIFLRLRVRGQLSRLVVIAGANPEGRDIAAMLQTEPWLGYQVIGFVDDAPPSDEPVPGIRVLGSTGDLHAILGAFPGATVIVASSAVESAVTNRLARDLLEQGIHVELSSTLRDISSQRLTVRPLGRYPVVYVEPVSRGGWRAAAKRMFDIVGASVGLIVASPILLGAMLAIRLESRGPVVFKQVRVGRDSEPFMVLKLRSMVSDAETHLEELRELNEADGPLFKMKDDPRITRVGRVIRATSIDELPQLWNVLRGEMSLVGPRPALPHETEEWDALLTQRLRVKPGITGMWQVSGRSDTSFEDYTRLDLYYVDNWSLTTDIAILAKTVPVVLLRQGSY